MTKKILALLLCALMLVSLAACQQKDVTAAPAPAGEDGEGTALDTTLPAFTLGDITVNVGELKSSFDTVMSYMSYYGVEPPTTDEEITEYVGMLVDDLLGSYVLPWKAKELGIEISDEEKAQALAEMEELVADYTSDYLDAARQELGEEASEADVADAARQMLEEDIESYFGYGFDKWRSDMLEQFEEQAMAQKLQDQFTAQVTVTDEEAQQWFEEQLKEQKETYDADYAAFKADYEAYRAGEEAAAPLYTPEGFAKVQVVSFELSQEAKDTLAANEAEIKELEAEFGQLALTNGDSRRQAAIRTRYAELLKENEALMSDNRQAAAQLRQEALAGGALTELISAYADEAGLVRLWNFDAADPKQDGTSLLYTLGQDGDYPEALWLAAIALKEGEVTEVIEDGNTLYVLRRLEDLPAQEAAFADVKEQVTAAALADKQQTEWEAIQADWLQEARNAAQFFEENYANLGK